MVKVNNDPENWTKSPEDYEKQMGKFRAKGFICFEEITDYSTLDPAISKKLQKKRKTDEISEEETVASKKSKKDKKEKKEKKSNDTKQKKFKENKVVGGKEKKSKKNEKSGKKESENATGEEPEVLGKKEDAKVAIEEKSEEQKAAEEAAKKLKREQKAKKIAKRRQKKEKRLQELKEKKMAKQTKSNSTSKLTMHKEGDEGEGFVHEDFVQKMKGWNEMMLPSFLLKGLYEKRFFEPLPIQKMVLPEAIKKKSNIIGTAQTGSGKTLAFGLPILTHLHDSYQSSQYFASLEGDANQAEKPEAKAPQALILTPTRELAIQIKEHLQGICKYQKTKIVVVVGGISQMKQERLLKQEPEIVVATPGRLVQMIDEGNEYLNRVDQIKYLVIDEADRMIEKGHFGEMERILKLINNDEFAKKKRQNFLFSATLITKFQDDIRNDNADDIRKPRTEEQLQKQLKQALTALVDKVQMTKEPTVFDLTTEQVTAENLVESKLFCSKTDKDIYLYYFVSKYVGRTLVFANSIDCVRRLNNLFKLLKKTPLQLHANMEQKQRLKNLEKFNAEPNSLMIASDVASRGLDIPNVMNVIHYQTPRSPELYVHRSGRTARSLSEGLSVMLVSPDEMNIYRKIITSVKKEKEIRNYPINLDYFDYCKKIVTLARKTDELEHQLSKTKNESNWYVKHSKLLDIDIDDELEKENRVDEDKLNKSKRTLAKNKAELQQLLKNPVFPKNFSKNYIASGNLDRFRAINDTSENALDGMRTTDAEAKKLKKSYKEIKDNKKLAEN